MIKKGYICINDRDLKGISKETLFVILTEKQAKDHKKFMEGYGSHHNIIEVKLEIKLPKNE